MSGGIAVFKRTLVAYRSADARLVLYGFRRTGRRRFQRFFICDLSVVCMSDCRSLGLEAVFTHFRTRTGCGNPIVTDRPYRRDFRLSAHRTLTAL